MGEEDTHKLVGEEKGGENEQALKTEVAKVKSLSELKDVLGKYKDIIHRDTDYTIQNIIETVQQLDTGQLSLADMPTQYGIKAKLTELLAFDKRHHGL